MNKQEFLQALEEKLTEKGLTHEQTRRQVEQFDRYLSVLPVEQLNEQLAGIDPDAVAENIRDLLQAEATQPPVAADPAAVAEFEVASAEEIPLTEEEPAPARRALRRKVPGSPLFWALFFLTLPIWGTLLLTLTALFLCGYAALIALIVGFVLALVVVAVAGTALSLYGIIYGIIQTFTQLSAGLFEIGLGVGVGGASMLGGILLYNAAIRLLPWLIRLVTKLVRYTWRKLADLYYFIKKECRS